MPQPPDTTVTGIAPGVSARTVVEATSSEAVASIVTDASASNQTLVPFGGAHSLVSGHECGPFDVGLDLRPLTGILSHEPADLVLSVRAGTTIGEIQSVLGDAGQALPIDVPFPNTATIGGVVATGFAGPRRLRSGSLRDLLIGCEFVRGDGLLAKGGGMVVKNVSGFEIPRFLHGSWGALAVITSVNLKVFPLSRADGTLVTTMPDLATALDRSFAITGAGGPPVDACTVTVSRQGIELAVRALGRQRAVTETLAACERLVGDARTIRDGESRTYWQSQIERFAEAVDTVVVAVATRPREAADLAASLTSALESCPGVDMLVSPGLGSMRVRWPSGPGTEEHLKAAAHAVERSGGTYVVECAPPGLRAVVPPWGQEPDGIDVMRAIKREFDPAAILNRGRLFV